MEEIFYKLLGLVLSMPSAKIDREAFLIEILSHLNAEEMQKALNESPIAVCSQEEIGKLAEKVIKSHLLKVTATSTVAGIPGGFAMAAAIPADLANYYYHIVTMAQKLAYLYGYPDLCDENGELTAEGKNLLIVFIGAMNNVKQATEVMKRVAEVVVQKYGSAIGEQVLKLGILRPIVAQVSEHVAMKMGGQLSGKTAGNIIGKAIPFISGAISGGLTYRAFRKNAHLLKDKMQYLLENKGE